MAARFLVPGGTGNWNSTTNWSATSGGASGASFPVAGDTVIFDVNSVNTNLTINVASACATLTCSNYTGTLTFNNNLTLTSTLTLASGMTTSGTGAIVYGAGTFTITCNGVYLRAMNLSLTQTITLGSDLLVVGQITRAGSTPTTINGGGFSIYCGGLTVASGGVFGDGATFTTVYLNGTGTFSSAGSLRCNVVIDTLETITMSSVIMSSTGPSYSFSYVKGTVNVGGSLKLDSAIIKTVDLNGLVLNNLTIGGGSTTLLSNINVNGNLTFESTSTLNLLGAYRIYVNGNATQIRTNAVNSSTVELVMNGTGTLSCTNTGTFNLPLTINTSGTVNIGTLRLGAGAILTKTSGTVIINPATTLLISGNVVLDIPETFVTVNITGGTITLLTKLTTQTLTVDGNIAFDGVVGWETDVFNLGTTANVGRTIILQALNTYRVNNNFNSIRSTNSLRAVLQSSSGVDFAIFTCGAGCVMNVGYTNAIRIDSSLGKQVYSFNGVYTTAINWSNTFPVSVAYAFQN